MKIFLILLLFPVMGFVLQAKGLPVFIVGENHTNSSHETLQNKFIQQSGSGKIFFASEGFSPATGRKVSVNRPESRFFGIEDEILRSMGIFLKEYILLHGKQKDKDIGNQELRRIFSLAEEIDDRILLIALKNLDIKISDLTHNQDFDTKTIKKIAQEMSRIAREGQLLQTNLIDIYDATISNPENYDLDEFVKTFLVEARSKAFLKNIFPIYEQALKENKPLVIYVGGRHLDVLHKLLKEEDIKVSTVDLRYLSDKELSDWVEGIKDAQAEKHILEKDMKKYAEKVELKKKEIMSSVMSSMKSSCKKAFQPPKLNWLKKIRNFSISLFQK